MVGESNDTLQRVFGRVGGFEEVGVVQYGGEGFGCGGARELEGADAFVGSVGCWGELAREVGGARGEEEFMCGEGADSGGKLGGGVGDG